MNFINAIVKTNRGIIYKMIVAKNPKSFIAAFIILCAMLAFNMPVDKPGKTKSTVQIDDNDNADSIIAKAARLVPTENQYAYKKIEFLAFVHFGPNTFTRMEWGNGMEDPKVFDLKNLDTDQWCAAMKSAGMKLVIITAKHHDGFCLWQSRYTKHGIMSSPFMNGKGDIVKSLAASCKKYGLKLGIYLSPADLNQIESPEGLYGNLSNPSERLIPRPVKGRPFANKTTFKFVVDDYNEYFLNQLFELLTEYGPVQEVWFDGAHPKRKGGQTYNYPAWKKLIRTLLPNAVIFAREDVRWCGNEGGATRDTEWDIIPFDRNPHETSYFPDLMDEDLGSREKLLQAKFLHFQPTETNTSIREGWFYRDDTEQKVRSVDDVFDIYERSVGGNSTFLLNIPPNREGKFSPEDVSILKEVGSIIKETYGTDLLTGAKGPKEVLDKNEFTHVSINDLNDGIVIETPSKITLNRLVVQENIAKVGQRVEEHVLDVWIDNQWVEVALGTTVGYKKILRFADVTTNKLRFRVLQSRLQPAISKISAHYCKSRPPQVEISRDADGNVSLKPVEHVFRWNTGESKKGTINNNIQFCYTTDGSIPNIKSSEYSGSFYLPSGEIKARAFINGHEGSISSETFGILKKDWKIIDLSSETTGNHAANIFDGTVTNFWCSSKGDHPHYVSIDLGKEYSLSGFAYTPQTKNAEGMIEKGMVFTSKDGFNWVKQDIFEFGNLINDPTKRTKYFTKLIKTRYIRIESISGAGGSNAASIAEIDFFEMNK